MNDRMPFIYWPHVSEAEYCNTEGVSSVLANGSRAAPAAQLNLLSSALMKSCVGILLPTLGMHHKSWSTPWAVKGSRPKHETAAGRHHGSTSAARDNACDRSIPAGAIRHLG